MNKNSLLQEVVEEAKNKPWFRDDPSEENKLDLYCEIGCEFYYGTEEGEDNARLLFERARWPAGIYCPRCEGDKISRLRAYRKYECSDCRYQFSVTSKTVFHKCRVPLRVLVGFIALSAAFEWKRGIRLYLSKLNDNPDLRNPISWPTSCRLWKLARKDNWLMR